MYCNAKESDKGCRRFLLQFFCQVVADHACRACILIMAILWERVALDGYCAHPESLVVRPPRAERSGKMGAVTCETVSSCTLFQYPMPTVPGTDAVPTPGDKEFQDWRLA